MNSLGPVAAQRDENGVARVCIVHEPTLANLWGNLHPVGRLYERPFNLELAVKEHRQFVKVLENEGVTVHRVTDTLKRGCDTSDPEFDMSLRLKLETIAMSCLDYLLAPGLEWEELTEEEQYYVSEDYKRSCVAKMHVNQLLQVVLTSPTVVLDRSHRDTQLISVQHSMNPIGNLIFTRDQQITTAKGIVFGNMASPQRQGEVRVMKEVFDKLGFDVIGEIKSPGKLEGGDFFPAGDTVFIGTGLRTNSIAVHQLMEHDLLGSKYVVEVRDVFERSQDRMHLDCVFNILPENNVLLMDTLVGPTSIKRRLATEYVLTEDGTYKIQQQDVEFSSYLQDRGYHIIEIPEDFQLKYGCNCLNLGNGTVVMMHEPSARIVASDPNFKGKIKVIDYTNVVSMYGSLHCTSQVVVREESTRPVHSSPQRTVKVRDSSPERAVTGSPINVIVVFAAWDVALTHRDGMPRDRLVKYPHLEAEYGNLKGRDLQELILREISALHLILKQERRAVHMFSCEEIYVPESSIRPQPTSMFTSHASVAKLAIYSDCAGLQSDALTQSLGFRYDDVIHCPIESFAGAQDMVIDYETDIPYFDQKLSHRKDEIETWCKTLGLRTPVFLKTKAPNDYFLESLLFFARDVVIVATELFQENPIALFDKNRKVSPAFVEISQDQVDLNCTSVIELHVDNFQNVALIVSKSVLGYYTQEQRQTLEKCFSRFIECELEAAEAVGIGSVRHLVIPLAPPRKQNF